MCSGSRTRGFIAMMLLAVAIATAGCSRSAHPESRFAIVEAADCAKADHPETGFQGQVPAALRASGFSGFNCNLKLVGQFRGEGAAYGQAVFHDPSGHTCAYMSTASAKNVLTGESIARRDPGVAVVDISEPTRPTRTTSLTSPAMLDPWESMVVNARRQVLAADAGENSTRGNAFVDFYDLSGDCRFPQLLSSTSLTSSENNGLKTSKSPIGHAGNFAPDGRTYYVGDIVNQTYNAVDVTDLTKPRIVAQFDARTAPLAGEGYNGVTHGLSVSHDGDRAYFVTAGFPSAADIHNVSYKNSDGFYIVDTSEIEARKPDASMRLVSATRVPGGSMGMHTLPFTVGGRSYLVFVDEGGGVGFMDFPPAAEYMKDVQAACEAGLSPYPIPKIYDITDERAPKFVGQLALQVVDPANCTKVEPDLAGLTLRTYGSHYCSVDNRDNATAIACSYSNSGIRVFDIRSPAHPREIAYYNPGGSQTAAPGSVQAMTKQWVAGGPDWCVAPADFDYDRGLLTTACMDNGLLVMKFENGVWPMRESSPSPEQH